ncbi:MAG: polysaccharide biosynthesis protein [Planctomycetes bacterium]|nr:polysaccharide biosynthesis protein [Planctomycetota bacterium]MBI3845875.1 polysaccharide biosynthesis protein [Planctomycetota bacterium]
MDERAQTTSLFDELATLFRHFVVYGIGNWLKPLLSFIMLPILTRYLTTTQYGTSALIVNTGEIVGYVIGSRLDAAVARLYFNRGTTEEGRRLVSTSILFITVFGLVACVLCAIAAPAFVAVVFGPDAERLRADTGFTPQQLASFFRVMFATLFFQLLSQVPLAFVKILKRSLYFAGTSVITLLVGVALNVFFVVFLEWGLWGVLLSALLVEAFRAASGLYFAIPKLKLEFDRRDLVDCVRYGAALVPGSIAVFALTVADRYFIKAFFGTEPVGVYQFAYKFGLLVSYAVTQPFMEIWRVRLFEIHQRGRAEKTFRKVFTYFSFVLVFAALLLSATIFDLVKVIAGRPDYWDAAPLVPVLALGYVFAGWRYYLELGFFLTLRPQWSSYVTIVAAVLNQGLNFVLIRNYGLVGAAWATTFSFLFQAVFAGAASLRFYPVRYEFVRVAKLLAVAGALFWLALQVQVESAAIGFMVRFLIASTYPIALLLVGFYHREEIQKMRDILNSFARKAE